MSSQADSNQSLKPLISIIGPSGLGVFVGIAIDPMVVSVVGRELIVGVELEPRIVESKPVALGNMRVEKLKYVIEGLSGSEAASACAARLSRSSDRGTDEKTIVLILVLLSGLGLRESNLEESRRSK